MGRFAVASNVAILVTALGGAAFATQTAASAQGTPSPKGMASTGTIVGFDDGTRTLTLSTPKGEEKFVLGSRVRLQEGAKTITTENLSGLAGHQAKVRYTASGSSRSAESVMVSGGARAKSSK